LSGFFCGLCIEEEFFIIEIELKIKTDAYPLRCLPARATIDAAAAAARSLSSPSPAKRTTRYARPFSSLPAEPNRAPKTVGYLLSDLI
jgi:hypothetical protein